MTTINISFELPVSKEALRYFENSNVQEYIKDEITEIMYKGLRQLVKYGDVNQMIIDMCQHAIQDQMDEVGIQAITDKIVDQLEYDGSKEEAEVQIYNIVHKNHVNNGYFSWDGILDDLAELIGDQKRASDVLRNV